MDSRVSCLLVWVYSWGGLRLGAWSCQCICLGMRVCLFPSCLGRRERACSTAEVSVILTSLLEHTMSCPCQDRSVAYTLNTMATSYRATGEGRAALFEHGLGDAASPGKACRDPNWLLDWDSGSEREAVIHLPLPSSQEIQTPSISQATAHWSQRIAHTYRQKRTPARTHARVRTRGRTLREENCSSTTAVKMLRQSRVFRP